VLRRGLLAIAVLAFTSCAEPGTEAPVGKTAEVRLAVEAPLPEAYCTVVVSGIGEVDTENDYLPHVITCENGGANLQALKAQAIAARSVVYYNMASQGSICDGQGCQVYSCGAEPSDIHYQAVAETSGMYLTYDGMLTYGFYVAGDPDAAPPGCVGSTGATEHYVTYNEGKSGGDVEQTSLGYIGPPGFGQNRGCMGQWGARCLENDNGYDYDAILRFYYGADIGIVQAPGSCVVSMSSPAAGNLDDAGCESIRGWAQDPDEPTEAVDVQISFDAAGDPSAPAEVVTAKLERADLCEPLGTCDHGFELPTPLSLHDGAAHTVHAYAIDTMTDEATILDGAPAEIRCVPVAPEGVRRRLDGDSVFDAWKFSTYRDVLVLDQDTIDAIPEGPELPQAPVLAKTDDGEPEVWLIDGDWRRHVPNPTAFAAWSFEWAAIDEMPADELEAMEQGTNLRPRPVLVTTAAGDVVYLIDDAPAAFDAGAADLVATCSCGAAGSNARGNAGAWALLAVSLTLLRRRRASEADRAASRRRTIPS
jgi:hypothetical protein